MQVTAPSLAAEQQSEGSRAQPSFPVSRPSVKGITHPEGAERAGAPRKALSPQPGHNARRQQSTWERNSFHLTSALEVFILVKTGHSAGVVNIVTDQKSVLTIRGCIVSVKT